MTKYLVQLPGGCASVCQMMSRIWFYSPRKGQTDLSWDSLATWKRRRSHVWKQDIKFSRHSRGRARMGNKSFQPLSGRISAFCVHSRQWRWPLTAFYLIAKRHKTHCLRQRINRCSWTVRSQERQQNTADTDLQRESGWKTDWNHSKPGKMEELKLWLSTLWPDFTTTLIIALD